MKTKKCLLIWTELINIVLTTSTKFGNFWRNLMVKFYKSIFNLKSYNFDKQFDNTGVASIINCNSKLYVPAHFNAFVPYYFSPFPFLKVSPRWRTQFISPLNRKACNF